MPAPSPRDTRSAPEARHQPRGWASGPREALATEARGHAPQASSTPVQRSRGDAVRSGLRQLDGYASQAAYLSPVQRAEDPDASQGGARRRAADAGAEHERAAPDPAHENDVIDAARMYVDVDPRITRAVGVALEVSGDPPGPEFVAKVQTFQGENAKPVTGKLDAPTLKALVLMHPGLEAALAECKAPAAHPLSTQVGGIEGDTGQHAHGQMKHPTFVGVAIEGGVHDDMVTRLAAAEASLAADLKGLLDDPEEGPRLREQGIADNSPASLKLWLGIKQNHTGWRMGKEQGFHRYGVAIDVNRDTTAWHAVRTGTQIGGEGHASNHASFDAEGIEVIDRANIFMHNARAELHAENAKSLQDTPGKAQTVAARLSAASQAVADYFALVFEKNDELLQWGVKPADDAVRLPKNLNPLPTATAIANVERVIREVHGGAWPRDAGAMVEQIQRDLFPLARNSAKGQASTNPSLTKNPLQGFMNVDGRLAAAMAEKGRLYWGACEFGGGQSGDSMHFDTGRVPPGVAQAPTEVPE